MLEVFAEPDDVLPEEAVASVALPPELFAGVSRNPVGVFFGLYTEPTLFPVRVPVRMENDMSSRRSEVASSIVAATVGPGLDFSDLDPPVVVNLRLSNITINRTGVSTVNESHVTAIHFSLIYLLTKSMAAGGYAARITGVCVVGL